MAITVRNRETKLEIRTIYYMTGTNSFFAAVKVNAEHADSGTPETTMEPITPDTADKMSGAAPKVEITKSKPS